ncbi:MAG: hypothetical protein IV085_12775 [Thiobacillus sp.]|nr:hypothetical protein [Thiobacillus sp.]
MKTLKLNVIALAVSMAFAPVAMAQELSKQGYKAGKAKIATEYTLAKTRCAPLSGNPKDICMAQAKGAEKVSMADLAMRHKPTRDNRHQARIAQAEANYAVASERCDDRAGNAKDVCLKEAESIETAAKADAKVQLKTSDASAAANEKSHAAHSKANEKIADAKKKATADRMEAEFKVAAEKCDTLAGNAKDVCVNEAKVRFSK